MPEPVLLKFRAMTGRPAVALAMSSLVARSTVVLAALKALMALMALIT
jgi:hypothetical protein